MTVKCFWCGAMNDEMSDFCCTCKRKLNWSNFFKAVLRPSVGYLMGDEGAKLGEKLVSTTTSTG